MVSVGIFYQNLQKLYLFCTCLGAIKEKNDLEDLNFFFLLEIITVIKGNGFVDVA